MRALLEKANRFFDRPLDLTPRVLILVAALLLAPTYLFPLWKLTMFAPQYQDGLRVQIYSWKLDGGNNGQDVREVNVLNHYIGMRDLVTADFTEFNWLPFAIGAFGLLFLRVVAIGTVGQLVDATVLFLYFSLFSVWSFGYRLWTYGHTLSPTAAVKVPPFMPPLAGRKQLANFEVYSYPSPASYALGGAAALLFLGLFLSWRSARREAAAADAGRIRA